MRKTPKRSFGNLIQKDDKKASESTKDITEMIVRGHPPEVEFKEIKEITRSWIKADGYIPKSERLLAIYDLLTDKSFPRKGKGKSTKPKILDAIINAAVEIKLKLESAHDV